MVSAVRKWFTSVSPESISATTYCTPDGSFRTSTASVSRIGNVWWVDRVKVHDDDLRMGIGRILVGMLKASLIENHDESTDDLVVHVCPGGYNTPPEVLREFYLACGFRIVKDSPELTMEWAPWRPGSTKSLNSTTRSESPATSTETVAGNRSR